MFTLTSSSLWKHPHGLTCDAKTTERLDRFFFLDMSSHLRFSYKPLVLTRAQQERSCTGCMTPVGKQLQLRHARDTSRTHLETTWQMNNGKRAKNRMIHQRLCQKLLISKTLTPSFMRFNWFYWADPLSFLLQATVTITLVWCLTGQVSC